MIIDCSDNHIRLMDETQFVDGQRQGRVEVCSGNAYFTVCNDFWDALEADVVCRYLEHSTSSMSHQILISYYMIVCHCDR